MGMHRALQVALSVAAVAALGACGAKTTTPAPTSATSASSTTVALAPTSSAPVTAPTTPPRQVNWIDLKAGDCLADPPPTDPAVVSVTVVDCAGPHTAETFLRADVPVDAAVTDTANQRCASGLSQYTGRRDTSAYTLSYLIDSEQDRTANNPYPSTVICLLQSASGQPLSGSARLN